MNGPAKPDDGLEAADVNGRARREGRGADAEADADAGERCHAVTLRNRGGLTLMVREDEAILDAFEREGLALPVACRYGGCITCAARLTTGKVVQPKGTALNKRQSRAGYVLLCVARPRSACTIDAGVESHTDLYQNPFAVKRA
ncbi:MAG: 2Fe-2S iron-sulfur cluster-binding protein [Pseudomonadota bacterium]